MAVYHLDCWKNVKGGKELSTCPHSHYYKLPLICSTRKKEIKGSYICDCRST